MMLIVKYKVLRVLKPHCLLELWGRFYSEHKGNRYFRNVRLFPSGYTA